MLDGDIIALQRAPLGLLDGELELSEKAPDMNLAVTNAELAPDEQSHPFERPQRRAKAVYAGAVILNRSPAVAER